MKAATICIAEFFCKTLIVLIANPLRLSLLEIEDAIEAARKDPTKFPDI